jgi:hypothetical protein
MADSILNNDQENVIKIETLTDYVQEITTLRRRLVDEGRSESLYFRGQSNVEWDIRPSVFRESLINVEDKIIQMAKERVPFEFSNCANSFEVLTKLQHYGLPTRLLDVTMNPLVALYFACYPIGKNSREDESIKCPDGAIYFCSAYGEREDSQSVKILSSIAQMSLNKDISLKKLKQKFELNESANPEKFIQILQSNILVSSCFSNNRIVCQSGAFMLSGAIMISRDYDIWDSKVQKSVCSLNREFDLNPIIISGEAKEQILDELDFFSINEGTLFPELEHQMSHIKRIGAKNVMELVPEFLKYDLSAELNIVEPEISDESSLGKDVIACIVDKYINRPNIAIQIITQIENFSKFPDWNKRESILNSLMSKIKHILAESNIENAKEIATNIIDEL